MRLKNKETEPKKGLPRLMELAMIKKGYMIWTIVLTVLATIISFVPYLAIYFIIREIIGIYPDFSQLDVTRITFYAITAIGGVLVNISLSMLAGALAHIAAYGTLYELKLSFVSHVTKLPLGFHLNTGSGKIRKIMDDNIESLEGFIAHDFTNMVTAFTSPVVMLVFIFLFDWRFGLATLVGIIFSFGVYKATSGGDRTKNMMGAYQNALEDMSNATTEYIRGIAVVKAFKQTTFSFNRLYESITNYTKTVIPFSLSQESLMASFSTALNSIYLFLIPVGILIGRNTTNYTDYVASFVFYLIFVPVIASMLMKVLYASVNAMQAGGAAERMDQMMSETVMPDRHNSAQPFGHDVVFENVTFSYTANDEESAIKDVSFRAEEGKTTAIVGPSGGGKSTIANLIPRFYDVDEGCIKIGGEDIREISLDKLMNIVSFVFQDNFLFKQSILENIRIGNPTATRDDVIRAAKAAQCHEFISELPQGYETVFGKSGMKLSGGQIQRIAIARAIVKNSPVLVLDEATSFSDPENEHLIQKALGELVKGKTVIMIAHRLSTIQDADQIIVMEHGRLVESGTHNELLGQKGKYETLWSNYTQALTWKIRKEVC